MPILVASLVSALLLALLLVSGAWVFGGALGSPARGASVPLLFIPLLADWLRWLGHMLPAAAFAFAILAYLLVSVGVGLTLRPLGPFSAMEITVRRRWWMALGLFLLLHVVLRTWLFTGSVPNPADDGFAGYKANAIIHSPAWPTTSPEVPELGMAYYYYIFTWPAAMSSWLHVPLTFAWWEMAIIFCVGAGMLLMELVLPRLKTQRDFLLAWAVVLNGSTLVFLVDLPFRVPPKNWGLEAALLGQRYGLYLRVPQFTSSYWSPFAEFETGLLLVLVVLFWRQITERKLRAAEFAFIVLALGTLAGYCTFDLIGFALVIVPVLTVAAFCVQKGQAFRSWVLPLCAFGVGAALCSLPMLLFLMHRAPGARQVRFRDPLLTWLHISPYRHNFILLTGLILWMFLMTILSNVAIIPVLFRARDKHLTPFTKLLLWIFCFGTLVCLFGVTDDFVSKFGATISMAAILAFYSMEEAPGWSTPLLVAGLFGTSFAILNTIRANLVLEKLDPVWSTLDHVEQQTHELVLYDMPTSDREKLTPWRKLSPYFSSIRFLVPADQVDDQGANFLVDPEELNKLPPTANRLRQALGGAPTYLLLRSSSVAPAGERLYRDDLFSVDRVSSALGAETPVTPAKP